jgi:hypothetical protein
MVNESVIQSYGVLFNNLLPAVSRKNRGRVMTDLKKLMDQYSGYVEKLKCGQVFPKYRSILLKCALNDFIKINFPEVIFKQYKNLSGSKKVSDGRTFSDDSVCTSSAVNLHICRYEWLKKVYTCLQNFGLHEEINNRNKAECTRYNLVVEHKGKRGQHFIEYILLMDFNQLKWNYIDRYYSNQALLVNGARVQVRNIKRLTITSTLMMDEELVLFREKVKAKTVLDMILACKDETNVLLNVLPSRTVIPVEFASNTNVSPLVFPGFIEEPYLVTPDTADFIHHFIRGMAELQCQDEGQDFIKLLKGGVQKDEKSFRNWFKTWFKSKYQETEAETEKGRGRVDLKVWNKDGQKMIIEFKGWWNKDKNQITDQLLHYLTEFEEAGFIFLVNHLRRTDIVTSYKKLITDNGLHYEPLSWKKIKYPNTNFTFYQSCHKVGNRVKIIYHFIYHVYG